ncbi:MAG: hypothetical protein N2109_10665 [Fimbriimonadales bacterium]|nr:hypothetical protein [Fimbriimonadales bacterium]
MTEQEFGSFARFVQWLVLALAFANLLLLPKRGRQAAWMAGAGVSMFLALWLRTQSVPAWIAQACWLGVIVCLIGHRASAKKPGST